LTTSTNPGTARARASSTETNLPPRVGHALTVAIFMPGTFASIPNCVAPTTLSGESIRRRGLPISVNAAGSLSATFGGIGSVPAAFASAPYASLRPLAVWATTPRSTVQLAGSTRQRFAAAVTSMVRATAPASRSTAH
jgi:hypothetical protein